MDEDIVPMGVIVTAILIIPLAFVGTVTVDAVSSSEWQAGEEVNAGPVLLDGLESVQIDDRIGDGEVVRTSLNKSLQFTGADDSYLESDGDIDAASGANWTIATGVWVNETATTQDNMTVIAVGDPNLILRYENSSGTRIWSAYYLTPLDGTYRANISAPDPTNSTYLFVTRAGSNITIWRGETQGESINVSNDGDRFHGQLNASRGCHCRLDETRTFDSMLNATQRATLTADPIAPLPGTSRTMRLMADALDGTSVALYWTSSSATVSNATLAPGYTGIVAERDTDYHWGKIKPKIQPIAGGALHGAPVVHVQFVLAQASVAEFVTDSITFYDLVPVVAIVLFVVGLFIAVKRLPDQ